MQGADSALWRLSGPLAQRALRRFVQRTQTDWARAGRVIHQGPVGAVCTACLPGWSGAGIDGALALVDGGLRFVGRRRAACDDTVPFETIRWVGLRRERGAPRDERRLAVHAERSGRWHVAVFALDEVVPFAEALAALAGLQLEDAGAGREDFGPAQALRLVEDVYGEWHADREGALYLAPDRLVFDWRGAIGLDAVEQISVVERAPRGRGQDALLRVEYAVGEDAFDVVGFAVPQAAAWADAIAARAGGALMVGRKTKDE